MHRTHPLVADTDRDGLRDGREVGLGSDPLTRTATTTGSKTALKWSPTRRTRPRLTPTVAPSTTGPRWREAPTRSTLPTTCPVSRSPTTTTLTTMASGTRVKRPWHEPNDKAPTTTASTPPTTTACWGHPLAKDTDNDSLRDRSKSRASPRGVRKGLPVQPTPQGRRPRRPERQGRGHRCPQRQVRQRAHKPEQEGHRRRRGQRPHGDQGRVQPRRHQLGAASAEATPQRSRSCTVKASHSQSPFHSVRTPVQNSPRRRFVRLLPSMAVLTLTSAGFGHGDRPGCECCRRELRRPSVHREHQRVPDRCSRAEPGGLPRLRAGGLRQHLRLPPAGWQGEQTRTRRGSRRSQRLPHHPGPVALREQPVLGSGVPLNRRSMGQRRTQHRSRRAQPTRARTRSSPRT